MNIGSSIVYCETAGASTITRRPVSSADTEDDNNARVNVDSWAFWLSSYAGKYRMRDFVDPRSETRSEI
ncbi:hypothetical protein JCM18750_39350 [Halostagnicola bangensis]